MRGGGVIIFSLLRAPLHWAVWQTALASLILSVPGQLGRTGTTRIFAVLDIGGDES